jgi:signal transduction histidine kinase
MACLGRRRGPGANSPGPLVHPSPKAKPQMTLDDHERTVLAAPAGTPPWTAGLVEQLAEAHLRRVREGEPRSLAAELTRLGREAGRARLLVEAGEVIGASLDVEVTLRSVARVAVQGLAECCVVHLVEEGTVHEVAMAHADPRLERVAHQLWRRSRLEPGCTGSRVAEAIRTGVPELIEALPASLAGELAAGGRGERVIRRLAGRSAAIVPLSARGQVVGCMTLIATRSVPRYDTEDVRLAGELARRAALALDNARLYRAAQEASRTKSDFLAVLSHEMRTPLTTVIGYADLLRGGVPVELPEPLRPYVDRIRAAAWHQLGIIEQILSFSRLDAGRLKLHPETTELVDVVLEAAGMLEPVADEKGLAFHVALPPGPVTLRTDPLKVRQILLNLLSNAVKFTQRGGIRVELEAQLEGAVIRVQDTGPGIEPAHRERIFEAFWQAENATTRRSSGTGLGLSVGRRLARLLGGDLEVASEPGAGSTFTLRIAGL